MSPTNHKNRPSICNFCTKDERRKKNNLLHFFIYYNFLDFPFLQPKWNNALLEMFRNEYIGTAPYISSTPSLCHHKLGANDHFLILSSDGLYQYLSNEEVVLHVESFMERFPDGDPAQSLIEELLFRAANQAGKIFICTYFLSCVLSVKVFY